MTPFRERNPVIIGLVSMSVLAVLLVAAFRAQDLPVIGGGDTYYAEFAEAGGLQSDDEVRIAGVRVGQVKSIELADGVVRVVSGQLHKFLHQYIQGPGNIIPA